MTFHTPTGRLIAPGGPVTAALRAMREACDIPPQLKRQFDSERAELDQLRVAIRKQIEADFDRIDRCLVVLDTLGGDPDLEIENEHGGDIQDEPHDEDADLEASLCGISFGHGSAFDFELDDSNDEDNGDAEPSLGAIEMGHTTRIEIDGRFTYGGADQSRWGSSGTDDREDGDDNGLADWQSLGEQGFAGHAGAK